MPWKYIVFDNNLYNNKSVSIRFSCLVESTNILYWIGIGVNNETCSWIGFQSRTDTYISI